MSNQKRKVRSWFISVIMLTSLLCAGYSVAKDKDQPQTPPETGKGQGKDKAQPHVGSIFDDQADEFEEPTYTPPADIEEKIKSIPAIPQNIKTHLKDKYVQIDDFIISTLQQTPHGPSGKISIGGDITPKSGWDNILKGAGTKEDRARGMAQAFIGEALSLFGITDVEELKESNIDIAETGYIHIYYKRYIGDLPLDNSDISVHIGPDEKIKSVQGHAVAPPPALYHAVAKKTLGRGKIYRIIRQELKTTSGGEDVGMGVTKAYKVAIPKPPYVIWKVSISTVDNAWDYRIDAFTGEILDKRSAMRSIR